MYQTRLDTIVNIIEVQNAKYFENKAKELTSSNTVIEYDDYEDIKPKEKDDMIL